ncbi:MAG: VWA domain-containing protein [Elusimicrobiota bacterium]|jgi:Ca-activated chloride channel family protein|nr:VWA domain-containing protein [Elusimicrobiota bacterium]
MKTDKEIIERFQNFDFDPEGKKQAQVLAKITAVTKAKKPRGRRTFTLAFSVVGMGCVFVLAGVAVKRFMPDMSNIKYEETYARYVPAEAPAANMAMPVQRTELTKAKAYAPQLAVSATTDMSSGVRAAGRAVYADVFSYVPPAAYHADSYNDMRDEDYSKYEENTFRSTTTDPVSTFSSDVDTASYNIIKRQIMQQNAAPNPDTVRAEEFINYFDYSYPQPRGKDPVSINFEYSDSPWNKGLKLVKVGIKAKDIEKKNLPPSNLVFLIDVSGSMYGSNRLPLVKKSLRLLVDELRKEDLVSIVTYADGVREVLTGIKGSEKEKIMQAVESLDAGGGTSGSDGLAKAYEAAKKNFIRNGNNRVILATDGDFNIGPSSNSELENQITAARESGVFLSVLGYGMGNYKDSKVQTLANKGNGNYAYINDLFEARKVLVKEFGATLFTVAKDVKIQAEFNPAAVAAYRLIGYEKRKLSTQDFNDDTKDAGEMGAGHTVTAIYEIIPAGVNSEFLPKVDGLKYAQKTGAEADEVLTLKLRYKEPSSDTSKLMESILGQNAYKPFKASSDDMRFAVSVAWFAQILKDSPFKGGATVDGIIKTARQAKGSDDEGYRADFIKMAEMYKLIK